MQSVVGRGQARFGHGGGLRWEVRSVCVQGVKRKFSCDQLWASWPNLGSTVPQAELECFNLDTHSNFPSHLPIEKDRATVDTSFAVVSVLVPTAFGVSEVSHLFFPQ